MTERRFGWKRWGQGLTAPGSWLAVLAVCLVGIFWTACSDDSAGGETDAALDGGQADGQVDAEVDAEVDGTIPIPDPILEICDGREPDDTASATTLQLHEGDAQWIINGLEIGDAEAANFLVEHPFRFDRLELFLYGDGEVEVHVWDDFYRDWPDVNEDLIPPVTVQVVDGTWHEVTFPTVYRDPSQRFWVSIVHISGAPHLALGSGSGDFSRFRSPALINPPFVWSGVADADYAVRVHGEYFCPAESRWFLDRTGASGVDATPVSKVAVGDMDGDGMDDLMLQRAGAGVRPRFWRNLGNLTFADATETTDVTGTYNEIGVWGDVDNDGDQDLYFGVNTSQVDPDPGYRSSIWLNSGDATFIRVASPGVDIPATTSAGAFGDYDGDGYLDLYVGNWLIEYPNPPAMADFLFKGQGDGTFVESSIAANIDGVARAGCYGVTWCDVNDDGWNDILAANYGYSANLVLLNQQDGTFEEVGGIVNVARDDEGVQGGNTFGIDCGDFDGDGHLDLFLGEITHPRYLPWSDPSRLMRWTGGGMYGFTYEDVTAAAGISVDDGMIDPQWGDYDNDGDVDLLINVIYQGHYARLYRNNGDGTFTDVTYEAGIWVHRAGSGVFVDLDRDGDLDAVIANNSRVYVYENTLGPGTRWIQLRLEGIAPSNRDAVGARVTATTGALTQIREVKAGKGHKTQSTKVVHFGFGSYTEPINIEIRWPSGRVESFPDMAENAVHDVLEGTGQ